MHHKTLDELTQEEYQEMDEYFHAKEEEDFQYFIEQQEELQHLADFMDELNPPETEVRGIDEQ